MTAISESSPLRNLPRALDPKLRARIYVLISCVDIIDYQYSTLLSRLRCIKDDIVEMGKFRVRLITSCWTIIDNLDIIRQVTQAVASLPRLRHWTEYSNTLSDVRKIRNGLDHINSNIGNIIESKAGLIPPIHGNLVYAIAVMPELLNSDATKCRISEIRLCSIAHGFAPENGAHALGCLPDISEEIKLPLISVIFRAFSNAIDLIKLKSELESFLVCLIRDIDNEISTLLDDQIIEGTVPANAIPSAVFHIRYDSPIELSKINDA